MQTHSQIVAVGTPWKLYGIASYLRLMDSVEEVNIRFFMQGRMVYEASKIEAGFYAEPAGGFDAVEIETINNPQLVKIARSNGNGGYDRFTGVVNLATATSILNTGVVNIATAATLVVSADNKRRGIRFLNSGTTVLYLGGAGVDEVNGCIKVNPGEILFESEAPSAAWFAMSVGGPGFLKVQELIG